MKGPADSSEPLYDTIWEEGEDWCSGNQRIEDNSFDEDSDGNHVEPMNMTNPDHRAKGEEKKPCETRLDDCQLSQMRSPTEEDVLEVEKQKLMMGSGGDLLEMVQSELLAKPIYSNQK